MKYSVFLLLAILSVAVVSAQKKLSSIVTTSGWTIKTGDSIRLGKGSNSNGSFRYVTSGEFLDAVKVTDKDGKQVKVDHSIDNSYNYKEYVVFKIFSNGTLIVKNGLAGRFTIDIESAIKSGELLQKPKQETVVIVNQGSVADELAKLKKLYDDGVITKNEFEAQKKKLLNK